MTGNCKTGGTKHSAPVGLGITGLDPSSLLTLTCLLRPCLVAITSKGVEVGPISARKRSSLCEARCFRSRYMNNRISANTATTPPTMGPICSRGCQNLVGCVGLDEKPGQVLLLPCKLLYIRTLFQDSGHHNSLLVAVALGLEEITPAWGVLLTAW